MRLPLLIHGKPSVLKDSECAKVSLGEGNWNIEHDVVDSKVHLRVNVPVTANGGTYLKPSEHQLNGKLVIAGPAHVQVYVNEVGTERHISVYAESK